MSGVAGPGRLAELLVRAALLCHPAWFRRSYGEEMLAYYREAWRDTQVAGGRVAALLLTLRTAASTVRVGLQQRLQRDRTDVRRMTGMPHLPVTDAWRTNAASGLRHDVRVALRSMRREPGFAAVVIATLALGIGANAAVFGVVRQTLLASLPYDDADRLVRIHLVRRGEEAFVPAPVVLDVRARARTLDGVAAMYNYSAQGADLAVGGGAERVRTLRVNADYFAVLGARPISGRGFRTGEERADARVAVVSERLLVRLQGSGESGPDDVVTLDGEPYTVAGVLPAGFHDPLEGEVDVWLPLDLPPDAADWNNNSLSVIAKLRTGSDRTRASAELQLLNAQQRQEHPELGEETARIVPLKEDLLGDVRPTVLVLGAASTLLLGIVGVNVAGLFLVRGAAREQELAVRSALGSSRMRLIRQLLVESVAYALAGGTAGLLLAQAMSTGLLAASPAGVIPASARLIDPAVLLYGLAVAIFAGLLFGSAPAWQFARPALSGILRAGGRGGDGGRRASRTRGALVIGEFALALVLLVSAGILLRSFQRLRALDLGVRADRVLTFQVNLPDARYADPAVRTLFHETLHRRIAALPGVLAVGATSRLPVTGSYHPWTVRRPGTAEEDGGAVPANQRVIAGDYFGALGIELVAGRVLDTSDRAAVERRVVVSRSLARRIFGEESPIGRTLSLFSETLTIVGVVADVAISPYGDVVPMVYHAHAQFADNRNWALTQVVSVARDESAIIDDVRAVLADLDPQLVLYQPRPLNDVLAGGIARERFATLLVATFGMLAVALAAIGIYGVLAYAVRCRRREIGIRVALGARPGRVRRMVVAQGARLAVAGLAIGVIVASLATRTLESLVFGVSVRDPLVFGVAAGLLGAVALLASWIPALGATRVHPAEAFVRE